MDKSRCTIPHDGTVFTASHEHVIQLRRSSIRLSLAHFRERGCNRLVYKHQRTEIPQNVVYERLRIPVWE
ncbi:hypothetical protein M404DRAFT_755117 [Pisolithus tinctorius Marx 270]|uniref:Uncharacterized protein n=1 Tax=Pisolithus tinctorius Marx 270 TaxID=870435 RepID=A0A0C3NZS3_PISTI|nr:hypothetical protein M404DRAFT_755117 [Pisolithus tinctorius Marx 270]